MLASDGPTGGRTAGPTASSRFLLALLLLIVLAAGGIVAAAAAGVEGLAPVSAAFHYPWTMLSAEAHTMIECVECHEPAEFHTCDSCHDEHGSAEMSGVPFNALLHLTGDVPEQKHIPINDILPYRDQPNTHVPLLDFLAGHGVTAFESVTLTSLDGGFTTFERPHLTSEALLMPHIDGVRFAAENLHVSTWLKGITRVIVVGPEKPLTIDGRATSIGRLLLGPTRCVTAEQTDVMFRSESDGQVRKGKTASRLEGAPVEAVVAHPDFESLLVRDVDGREHTISAADAQNAILAQLWGHIILVLPGRGRPQWIEDVVEITSQR
jgi:hypothetical protein